MNGVGYIIMSSKIQQGPSPINPSLIPVENLPRVRQNEVSGDERRSKPSTKPLVSVSSRKPLPLDVSEVDTKPVISLEVDSDSLGILSPAVADQLTYDLTKLYLTVRKEAESNHSLVVSTGLKALEELIRHREIVHRGRTGS